jgi:hypothetical protein
MQSLLAVRIRAGLLTRGIGCLDSHSLGRSIRLNRSMMGALPNPHLATHGPSAEEIGRKSPNVNSSIIGPTPSRPLHDESAIRTMDRSDGQRTPDGRAVGPTDPPGDNPGSKRGELPPPGLQTPGQEEIADERRRISPKAAATQAKPPSSLRSAYGLACDDPHSGVGVKP